MMDEIGKQILHFKMQIVSTIAEIRISKQVSYMFTEGI